MSGEPLVRTSYRDPTTGIVRSGSPAYTEVNLDVEQYHQAHERIHGSGPHSFGVAGGLGVTAVAGQKGITVQPGVAIDAPGRHISLGAGGQAQVGTTADQHGNPIPAKLVPVAANGVPCDTTGLTGDFYVTIQWYETFDWNALQNHTEYQIDDTPWIQFQAPAGFNADGNNGIVLARVTLDNASNVTALTEDQRFTAGLRAGAIRIERGHVSAPDTVGDTVSAGLDPLPAGGLGISATQVTAQPPGGTPSIVLDTGSATGLLGTRGVAGHVDVRGPNGQYSVFLNGDSGHIITGGPELTGMVRVKNANANDTIQLEGGAGDLWYNGSLQDPNGAHPPVTHDDLRQLTTGVLTDLHQHHAADASAPFTHQWMFCNSFNSFTMPISLPLQMSVFASIVITSILPINGAVDYDDALLAEIYQIDGNDHRGDGWVSGDKLGPPGDDANLRAPQFQGEAQKITFRLRSRDDCAIWALAIVYTRP
jgi:hypothetical protein